MPTIFPTFEQKLQKWVEEGGEEENRENRQIAAIEILDVRRNHKTTLFLCHLQLTSLPDVIWSFTHLKMVYLRGNKFMTLPESIGNLSELETLVVEDNKLTTLPETIGTLLKLQRILLGSNRLTTLPDAICDLSDLQALQVSAKYFDTLVNFTSLDSLLSESTQYGQNFQTRKDEIIDSAQEKMSKLFDRRKNYLREQDYLNEAKLIESNKDDLIATLRRELVNVILMNTPSAQQLTLTSSEETFDLQYPATWPF